MGSGDADCQKPESVAMSKSTERSSASLSLTQVLSDIESLRFGSRVRLTREVFGGVGPIPGSLFVEMKGEDCTWVHTLLSGSKPSAEGTVLG